MGDIFLQLLGNKMTYADHGNAALSGQQKQQNVPVGRVIKVVAAVMGYALWLFFKWSLQADGLGH